MKHKYIFFLIIPLVNTFALGQATTLDTVSSTINLDQVVISANKMQQSTARVSQEIRVIDSKEIAMLQAQTTADLLQSTSSLSIQKSQQGGGSTVIRGFEANRVLLMVDGVRMNNAIYRAGHLQNVLTLDNNSLDRVEVLYGPASTIYGSDALGGAIHFYTKKPKFSLESGEINHSGNAFVRYGSANSEKTGHIDFNIGGLKLASMTSFTYSDFGDLRMGEKINPSLGYAFGERPFYVENINGTDQMVANDDPYKQIQSAYHQFDLIQKLQYKTDENNSHGLNFQYSNTNDIPRYDRLTDPGANNNLSQAEWYYGPQKRMMIAYDYNHKANGSSERETHFGINYQDVEESRNSRRFGSSKLSSRIEKIKVIGLNYDAFTKLGKNSLHYGLDAQYNALLSTAFGKNINNGEISAIDTRYPDGDNKQILAGVYVSHSLNMGEKWILNDGLRLGYASLKSTFVSKEFFPFPFDEAIQNNIVYSGNLGFVYNPSNRTKIAAGLSSGFRVPNIDDLSKVFESAPGSVIVPNPDLKPEKTVNAEACISHAFTDNLKWQGVLYHTWLIDAIVADAFQFNGSSTIIYDGQSSSVLANQNKRKAFISGFSSAIDIKFNSLLALNANVSYTYGRIVGDAANTPLDHIPPLAARIGINFVKDKFAANFYTLYNGWKHIEDYFPNGEDNEQYAPQSGMPSWYTFNLKLKFDVTHNIGFKAGVENIFDLQYRTFASGINAAGRNFSITVVGKW